MRQLALLVFFIPVFGNVSQRAEQQAQELLRTGGVLQSAPIRGEYLLRMTIPSRGLETLSQLGHITPLSADLFRLESDNPQALSLLRAAGISAEENTVGIDLAPSAAPVRLVTGSDLRSTVNLARLQALQQAAGVTRGSCKRSDDLGAVIDGGVDPKFVRNLNLQASRSFVEGFPGFIPPDSYHGTQVAAVLESANPCLEIVSIQVWKQRSVLVGNVVVSGVYFTTESLMQGFLYLEHLAGKRRVIANASLSVTWNSPVLNDMLRRLADKLLLVSSAGNENVDTFAYQRFTCNYELDNGICVGSLERNGEKSPYSNWGRLVAIAAYGSLGTAMDFQGTSFAAPQVAGAASLIWRIRRLSPKETKQVIVQARRYNPALAGFFSCSGQLDGEGILSVLAALPQQEPIAY